MDNVCILSSSSYIAYALKNMTKLLAFGAKNNQNPAHLFFDKKVKGILYSEKSTVSFNLLDLKSHSPNQVQPHRPNVACLDHIIDFLTKPISNKK